MKCRSGAEEEDEEDEMWICVGDTEWRWWFWCCAGAAGWQAGKATSNLLQPLPACISCTYPIVPCCGRLADLFKKPFPTSRMPHVRGLYKSPFQMQHVIRIPPPRGGALQARAVMGPDRRPNAAGNGRLRATVVRAAETTSLAMAVS